MPLGTGSVLSVFRCKHMSLGAIDTLWTEGCSGLRRSASLQEVMVRFHFDLTTTLPSAVVGRLLFWLGRIPVYLCQVLSVCSTNEIAEWVAEEWSWDTTVRSRGTKRVGGHDLLAAPWCISSSAQRICRWGSHSRGSAFCWAAVPLASAWGRPAGRETLDTVMAAHHSLMVNILWGSGTGVELSIFSPASSCVGWKVQSASSSSI